ncbi:MAG TPA: hypothetical protein DCZ75_03450 [Geobacter sp.]|nr:hypothetical protein [Geobacter sp.]
MLSVAIKILAVGTALVVVLQYFRYATTRGTPDERRRSSLPLGITLFILAVAGFASRDRYLAFLSVVLVALSLWLGPTTWRGKDAEKKEEP